MREAIQVLRRDKMQHQQIQDKLDREAHQKQNEIDKILVGIQAANENRDRANHQAELLRQQLQEESIQFESGWREKKVQLEQSRDEVREIPRHRRRKPNAIASMTSNSNQNRDSELPAIIDRDSNSRLESIQSTLDKEAELNRQIDRKKAIEQDLANIKKKTGVKDAEELAQALLSSEEKNFALFNMINELNTGMEVIDTEIKDLECTIDSLKGLSNVIDFQRHETKQQLQDQIIKSRQKVSYLESRHTETFNMVEMLKAGAQSILHKIGYADEELVQGNGGSEVDIIKLLGCIERRIGELVNIHNITTGHLTSSLGAFNVEKGSNAAQALANGRKSAGKKVNVPSDPMKLQRPTPPTAVDVLDYDSDDQEEGLRLCSLAEIHEKAAAALLKRREKQTKTRAE